MLRRSPAAVSCITPSTRLSIARSARPRLSPRRSVIPRIAAATRARTGPRPITSRDLLSPLAADPCGPLPGHGPDACAGFGHPQDMDTGGGPRAGVCVAADVHYLSGGGARAAAILAADAAFAYVL